jgi:phosphate-selective porin OprO and OprP
MRERLSVLLVCSLIVCIDPPAVHGQMGPGDRAQPVQGGEASSIPSVSDLSERLRALEEELLELRTQQQSPPAETSEPPLEAAAKPSESKERGTPRISEWQDISDEKWNVKLGGHIQMDYVLWPNADPAIANARNYFNYRRLRLVADGTGYGVFDFRLQMTLEPGQGTHENEFATPDVKDAYVTMREIPGIGRFRIGNFFVPFSLEQVTNDTNNIFLERSIPTQGIFAADREVGVAFYNATPDRYLTWTGGLFFDDINDTVKTRVDSNQGYRLSGRVTWLPYYDEPSEGRYLIHTGVGVLHTDDFDDRVRFRARPQVQRGPILIDSGNLLADKYTTGNVELAIVWGRITLQNEALLSRVHGFAEDFYVGGAYSHLSWFLTGENRNFERFGQHGANFARNRPFTNFFATPGGVGWGAWEAKARWSFLDLTNVNAGQYNDLAVGFNWYWSDRTRIMFDWIRPMTTADAVFGSTRSDLLGLRFDVNW